MRSAVRCIVALMCSALIGASEATPTQAAPGNDGPPLWTATAPGRPTLLLLPTIHFLSINDARVDPWLAQLATRVQAIVLEVPPSLNRSELQMARRFGIYDTADNLTNHARSMTAEQLAGCARQSGLNIVQFLQLKPWLAAMVLDTRRMTGRTPAQQASGSLPADHAGIDLRLFHLAQKNMIPLIYLETLPQALKLFDDMPFEEQDASLYGACHDLTGTTPGDLNLNELEEAWLDGDASRLGKLITTRDPHEERAHYEETRYVLEGGTALFAATMQSYGYFHGKGPILVAVGAAHFFGDDSLLHRLEMAGYSITAPHNAGTFPPSLKTTDSDTPSRPASTE
ncbi:TraB/GumN family protein [Paraburkholderia sp. J12]|uniref:TraB/GumN family protein n=1 Tax=Paraburkholderia sp. J12 TaxID=2805432 RepID=UPI002ABE61EF|nr:TraB/GumN family protein [Paraburkholderia sp. J12]